MIRNSVILFWGVPVFAGIICAIPIGAAATELSVYAPGGVRSALQVVAVVFEKQTGHTIKFTFGTGGGIQKQIAAGAPADVTVLPSKGISELEKAGFVVPKSRLEVGSVGVGIGIKAGMPRPKIDTMEKLRETLLAAKSITYADPARGGTSGTYFATVVLPRLGIVEQMKDKTALTAVGEDAVRRVVKGESEIVVVQSSEITAIPGAELVGPLPAGIQNAIPYAAVVLKSSKNPDVARAFVAFLDSPAGRAAFKKAGFQNTGTR
ncbi:MAG TPA: molybdate ABC transporter substrate-binding protein [Syntrophales bacterium]|nr:molybdate ABC transporter substrate-binding protein [Syntrophales bacterium]